MSIAWSTLTELKGLLDRGETSALELTAALLDRVERADPKLHAFVRQLRGWR